MAKIWYGRSATSLVNDRPMLQHLSDGGVLLQLAGRDGTWMIELTRADCEHIAEAIDHPSPGARPAVCDD